MTEVETVEEDEVDEVVTVAKEDGDDDKDDDGGGSDEMSFCTASASVGISVPARDLVDEVDDGVDGFSSPDAVRASLMIRRGGSEEEEDDDGAAEDELSVVAEIDADESETLCEADAAALVSTCVDDSVVDSSFPLVGFGSSTFSTGAPASVPSFSFHSMNRSMMICFVPLSSIPYSRQSEVNSANFKRRRDDGVNSNKRKEPAEEEIERDVVRRVRNTVRSQK